MKLNEKLASILAIAEDDRRQESISRADRHKPDFVKKLVKQATKGVRDGLTISDQDSVYLKHLREYFYEEGFAVGMTNNELHVQIGLAA